MLRSPRALGRRSSRFPAEDDDLIDPGERRGVMGDQQDGAVTGGVEDVIQHGVGAGGVEPLGGFVEHEDGRVGGLSPLFVILLIALVVGTTAVQVRSRWPSTPVRQAIDVLAVAGGAVAAAMCDS